MKKSDLFFNILGYLQPLRPYQDCDKEVEDIINIMAGHVEIKCDKKDIDRLDFLEKNKEYVVGFAPSGDFTIFRADGKTAYGKTIRECIDQGILMHNYLKKGHDE